MKGRDSCTRCHEHWFDRLQNQEINNSDKYDSLSTNTDRLSSLRTRVKCKPQI